MSPRPFGSRWKGALDLPTGFGVLQCEGSALAQCQAINSQRTTAGGRLAHGDHEACQLAVLRHCLRPTRGRNHRAIRQVRDAPDLVAEKPILEIRVLGLAPVTVGAEPITHGERLELRRIESRPSLPRTATASALALTMTSGRGVLTANRDCRQRQRAPREPQSRPQQAEHE